MVIIDLITVDECESGSCKNCDAAEAMFRRVLHLANSPLPDHLAGGPGEAHLADGRTLQVRHMRCGEAEAKGFPVEHAPFLCVDHRIILQGDEWDHNTMAEAVLKALFPNGLADATP